MSVSAVAPVRRSDVLRTLVERQLKLRAQRAVFAFAWPAIAPLVMLALYTFVFKSVFHIAIPRYGEFLFAGLLPWSYLALTLGYTIQSLTMEPELVRRARFPYEMLPVSSALALFLPFVATLTGFVAYLGIRGRLDFALLALLIVPVASLLMFVAGIAIALSLIDVYNRDLRQILGNLLTVWFFLVPIVYRHEMAPMRLSFLRSIDPMNMIVGQFRDVLFWRHISVPAHMGLVLAVSGAFLAASLAVFRRFAPNLPKDV